MSLYQYQLPAKHFVKTDPLSAHRLFQMLCFLKKKISGTERTAKGMIKSVAKTIFSFFFFFFFFPIYAPSPH